MNVTLSDLSSVLYDINQKLALYTDKYLTSRRLYLRGKQNVDDNLHKLITYRDILLFRYKSIKNTFPGFQSKIIDDATYEYGDITYENVSTLERLTGRVGDKLKYLIKYSILLNPSTAGTTIEDCVFKVKMNTYATLCTYTLDLSGETYPLMLNRIKKNGGYKFYHTIGDPPSWVFNNITEMDTFFVSLGFSGSGGVYNITATSNIWEEVRLEESTIVTVAFTSSDCYQAHNMYPYQLWYITNDDNSQTIINSTVTSELDLDYIMSINGFNKIDTRIYTKEAQNLTVKPQSITYSQYIYNGIGTYPFDPQPDLNINSVCDTFIEPYNYKYFKKYIYKDEIISTHYPEIGQIIDNVKTILKTI